MQGDQSKTDKISPSPSSRRLGRVSEARVSEARVSEARVSEARVSEAIH